MTTMTKKRGQINRDDALELRAIIRGDATVGSDTQFMRRLRLRGGKLCTVICHHCCVAGRYSGYVHIDGTDHGKAASACWN